jgi:hypothetical protein
MFKDIFCIPEAFARGLSINVSSEMLRGRGHKACARSRIQFAREIEVFD